MWDLIGRQADFPNTCTCDTALDNGAGLSWRVTVGPGQSTTLIHYTSFSSNGRVPLVAGLTADPPAVGAGGEVTYTLTLRNPNAEPAPVTALEVDLPDGFSYVAGSVRGATTAAPVRESGAHFVWRPADPVMVPANGDVRLTLGARAGSDNGSYTADATAVADGFSVVPVEDVAPVRVSVPRRPAPSPAPAPSARAAVAGARSYQDWADLAERYKPIVEMDRDDRFFPMRSPPPGD